MQRQITTPAHDQHTWPIAACMIPFAPTTSDGRPMHQASPEEWNSVFREIAMEGFSHVEIGDGWIKPALLAPDRLDTLRLVAEANGLQIPAVHIQRVSVIDPIAGDANLAYHHDSVEAVAALGASVYSMGLHRPLTPAQRDALWFWTAQGAVDPDDADTFALAVRRVREIGAHAAAVGLDVSLELYEDTYLGTGAGAVRFVEAVGLDNVGLNPDVGNLIRLHRRVEDWRDVYAATLPYANYWHLKNYARDESPDGSFVSATPSTLRDGLINYREVIALALELGYSGPFTCEQYGGDALSVCGENSRYIRHILDVTLDAAVLTTAGA